MLSVVKTAERIQARRLRAQGCSIKEIQQLLGVSRSSVSLWVRDVPLTPEQQAALIERIRLGPMRAGVASAARARERRAAFQEHGRLRARDASTVYAAGCMLYWAEGGKRRNSVHLTNADPQVLAFFARFLREELDVADDAMSVYCNLFADHLEHQSEIEQFWLDTLRLPRTALRKSIVNVYSKYSQKKRDNKLPYGTCRLVVHSTEIVQTIYGSIQEYGGFDRPEWLD
jgi:transcriptional regulator with XRE-family HTH domain